MAKLRLAQFSGEIPRLLPRLLPESGSQYAENVRLDDGGLKPIRRAALTYSFTGITGIKTIFKWGTEWLAWTSVVHALPGPVATDRLYYTGDGVPKMRVGTFVYDLALPLPTVALTAAVTGIGTGDITTRLYAYTWVTSYGEESEPCPVSADVLWQSGQTVTLSGFEPVPAGRAITLQRIYRSQSSNQSGTDLFLIDERPATTSNYVDVHAPDQFGAVLPSRDWNPPPADLAGLVSLPNGMMAGFSGKQLCFCEPYRPHAWPEKYRMTAAFNIVGLGAYGTTVVAGTEGYPYVASGYTPDSMVEQKIEVNLPCVNGRGMVDLGYSVAYPSNDGLVVVSTAGATVATDALFTRPAWQKLAPATLVASQFAGRYMASSAYMDIDGVTTTDGTYIIDLTNQQPFVIRASFRAEAMHYDLITGQLYYLIGSDVFEYDALGQVNEIMTWKSKRVVSATPITLGAILAESNIVQTPEQKKAAADQLAAIQAANALIFAHPTIGGEVDAASFDAFAMNADQLQSIPSAKFISIMVFADGRLIKTISTLDKPKRLPPRSARVWEVQVNGTAEIEQITLATSARELTEF